MLAEAERRVKMGLPPFPEPEAPTPTIGSLLEKWLAGLTNKSAPTDRWLTAKHLRPRWAGFKVDAVNVGDVLAWLDEMQAAGKLSPQSRLANLGLLSRFYSWCVERGHAQINPVAMVPRGRRPKVPIDREQPWIRDDELLTKVMAALGEPLSLMLWLGNRTGMRLGEICGLRMGDTAWIGEGTIRVAHSYDGELKESHGRSIVKWTVAPDDTQEVIGPWLERRRAEGAKDEDLVFVYSGPPQNRRTSQKWKTWRGWHPHEIQSRWRELAGPLVGEMTMYQAGRHSFASRSLRDGATLDEVSEAMGHSSPAITKRRYVHHVRRTFSEVLRRPMTPGKKR